MKLFESLLNIDKKHNCNMIIVELLKLHIESTMVKKR
jgi:hypothetical protein